MCILAESDALNSLCQKITEIYVRKNKNWIVSSSQQIHYVVSQQRGRLLIMLE